MSLNFIWKTATGENKIYTSEKKSRWEKTKKSIYHVYQLGPVF
jgi:hypothetical protein